MKRGYLPSLLCRFQHEKNDITFYETFLKILSECSNIVFNLKIVLVKISITNKMSGKPFEFSTYYNLSQKLIEIYYMSPII